MKMRCPPLLPPQVSTVLQPSFMKYPALLRQLLIFKHISKLFIPEMVDGILRKRAKDAFPNDIFSIPLFNKNDARTHGRAGCTF